MSNNYQRRPCPKCGASTSVRQVQNDWNRLIPVRYRDKNYIRRRIDCSDPKCDHRYWTIEIPEEQFGETLALSLEDSERNIIPIAVEA